MLKFLADSGAIEHLTNKKLVFRSLDEKEFGVIRCFNKDVPADLNTEGVGTISIFTKNYKLFDLNDVIYAEALSENLLLRRKFVDEGLAIYLDRGGTNSQQPSIYLRIFYGFCRLLAVVD